MYIPDALSNVVAIAAGSDHSLALRSDGTVIGWGLNDRGQATGIGADKLDSRQDYEYLE